MIGRGPRSLRLAVVAVLLGAVARAQAEPTLTLEQVLVETRGARYQRLDTLVFQPSLDIGLMAGEHLRRAGDRGDGHGVQGWMMTQILRRSRSAEADWASYVLFDGSFAAKLIELGRSDARARAEDIRRFFPA